MPIAVVFIQGLFEIVGLGGFLTGYFADIWWLMVLGGCLVVLDDIIEIGMGILNPIFPVSLAVILSSPHAMVRRRILGISVFLKCSTFRLLRGKYSRHNGLPRKHSSELVSYEDI